MNPLENLFNPAVIQEYLTYHPEYAWIAVFSFAFFESMVISGSIVPSIVLFSVCVFLFDQGILSLIYIAPIAILGAHLGDVGGFLVGKYFGTKVLEFNFFQNRKSLIDKATIAADRFGPLAVVMGRFMPAIRPIMPFFLGVTRLKTSRFYIADIVACSCWGLALVLMLLGVQEIGFINTIIIALIVVLSFFYISNKVTKK